MLQTGCKAESTCLSQQICGPEDAASSSPGLVTKPVGSVSVVGGLDISQEIRSLKGHVAARSGSDKSHRWTAQKVNQEDKLVVKS